MTAHYASNAYALRLRVGTQNRLLSPLLVLLYARLHQIPDATVHATLRSFGNGVHELNLLLNLPHYPIQHARNLLISWAETSIDRLNHAHPYSVSNLLNQNPAKENREDNNILVKCEPVNATQWLQEYASTVMAPALVTLSGYLNSLLQFEVAHLKTTLPVVITASLNAEYPDQPSDLFDAVFANTTCKQHIAAMLKNWRLLENQGRVIRRSNLPVATVPLFTRLLTALQHGMASIDESGKRFAVIRLLMNQLGFSEPESDYLILLSLPQAAIRLLQQQLETFQ